MTKEKIFQIVGIVVVVGVVGGLAFFGANKWHKQPVAEKSPSVATVNGVVLTQADFDTQLATTLTTLKSQGVNTEDPTKLAEVKAQVLNDMISNELVAEEIAKEGIKTTDSDVETQYQTILTQVGGADQLKTQLASANMTDTQLRTNISKQLTIKAYLLKHIDMNTATASPTEISKFYDDNVKGQKGAPTLKDITDQIKQQIINTKQQLLINTFIASLREKAKVETTLK